jgi:hypothetical protein
MNQLSNALIICVLTIFSTIFFAGCLSDSDGDRWPYIIDTWPNNEDKKDSDSDSLKDFIDDWPKDRCKPIACKPAPPPPPPPPTPPAPVVQPTAEPPDSDGDRVPDGSDQAAGLDDGGDEDKDLTLNGTDPAIYDPCVPNPNLDSRCKGALRVILRDAPSHGPIANAHAGG